MTAKYDYIRVHSSYLFFHESPICNCKHAGEGIAKPLALRHHKEIGGGLWDIPLKTQDSVAVQLNKLEMLYFPGGSQDPV